MKCASTAVAAVIMATWIVPNAAIMQLKTVRIFLPGSFWRREKLYMESKKRERYIPEAHSSTDHAKEADGRP